MGVGGGGGILLQNMMPNPQPPPPNSPLFIFFFQSYVTLSFHSSTICADFWLKIILIGICSCLSAFYHTLMWMLWFKFPPWFIFFPLC